MKVFSFLQILVLGLLVSLTSVYAHVGQSGNPVDGLVVTRHFTGSWDQVNQETQGLSLDVIEQADGSRKSVVYWFTYGDDRRPTWYLGIGDLMENRIEYTLQESSDVGFMQDALPGNESVKIIGSMTIEFDSCNSGLVTYETDHEEVGSGSFNIERLTEVMNTHCSGGISDDMPADGMFGMQRLELTAAREEINGTGYARYEDYPAHMEFEVEIENMLDGMYDLYAGGTERGSFEVSNGRGEIRFSSPAEDGHMLMNFDPRGMQIDVYDTMGLALSSFDRQFEQDDHQHHGGGHDYDCSSGHMGGGMGMGGMKGCVEDGDFVDIEAELQNTGVLFDAEGEAEWEMNAERVRFSVEIEDVPEGQYPFKVGGVQVGIIEARPMHGGEVFGRLNFRDPATYGMESLDFEPRGKLIEVLQGDTVILETVFPEE